MLEGRSKEFDELFRSVMEDVTEEVPEGVWESVSGRLDRIASRRKAFLWMRRAGAGLAAAAAVALAIILPGSLNNSNNLYIESGQETEIAAVAQSVPEAPVTEEQENHLTAPAVRVVSETPATRPVAEPVKSEPEATPQKMQQPRNAAAGTETKTESETKTKTEEKQTKAPFVKEADPFSVMAFQDSRRQKSGGTTMSIDGNIQSNSLNPDNIGFSHMGLPSSSTPSQTGISEISDSKFGIPVSVGIGIRFPLSNRLFLGTGINYTLLTRSFTGTYTEVSSGAVTNSVTGDIKNYQHYIGVPVNLIYNVVDAQSVKFYFYGGGMLERSLANKYLIQTGNISYSTSVKGIQASLGAGLGVEFKLTKGLGLYVAPGVRYYFDCNQPVSIRTKQPLMMNLDIGLRFGVGKEK